MNLKLAWLGVIMTFGLVAVSTSAAPIDRRALVARHAVEVRRFDVQNPLSVGNGEFAFTVDATGLQTFPKEFTDTTPLGTLADWGWHTMPNPEGWSFDRYPLKQFPDLHGRLVPYDDVPHNQGGPADQWLRANPQRMHLGRIGLVLRHPDGSAVRSEELTAIDQRLDLWRGEITSHFCFDGQSVTVWTVCAPDRDAVAVRIESPAVRLGHLRVEIAFPYATPSTATADWDHPQAHTTVFTPQGQTAGIFSRQLDQDYYSVAAAWSPSVTLTNPAPHDYQLRSDGTSDRLELVCDFRRPGAGQGSVASFAETERAAVQHWQLFWQTGGAIDLSGSTDSRWFELERRIVLSEYLTAIQSAGENPPAETGLTYNSWNGKFHLEMHWWHEAHFALWNRLPLLERSLAFYERILPKAEAWATKQGYTGARWPKMCGPDGTDSPSPVGPFLIWQQPHPIFYAELCRRAHPDRVTLERYLAVVQASAEFMASFATWDEPTGRYVLGPTLQCAQEKFPKDRTFNPTFELTYWRWGLETAQAWRQALGLPREPHWDDVLQKLAVPSVAEGKYLFAESAPDSYTNPKWNADHPAVLGAFSFVPGPGIRPPIMSHTLDWVWTNWNWPDTWGWDYPLMAMTAARLGQPDRAVDALLLDTPKNHYALNGQVYQRRGLSIYLPANGGLLYAVALMAAGWDGAPSRPAPGFPDDGRWSVRSEGLVRAP